MIPEWSKSWKPSLAWTLPLFEWLTIAIVSGVFVWSWKSPLIDGDTFPHISSDGFIVYHHFQFVARSVQAGILRFWDFYNGSPFYLNSAAQNYYDPFVLGLSQVGQWFTNSFQILYNWKLILLPWFGCLGIYFFVREMSHNRGVAAVVFLVATLSSLVYTNIRQPSNGAIIFCLFWILYFALRCFRYGRLKDYLGLSLFLFWSIQGYVTVISWLFLVLLFFFLWIQKPDLLQTTLTDRRRVFYVACSFGVSLLGFVNPASLFLDMADYSLGVSRSGAFPGYSAVEQGTHAGLWDYAGMFVPRFMTFNYSLHHGLTNGSSMNKFSENFIYIGILPLVLATVGILFGRSETRKPFLYLLLILILISFGSLIPVHQILFYAIPPIQMARHMHLINPLVVLCLVYFVFEGLVRLGSVSKKQRLWETSIGFALCAFLATVALLVVTRFDHFATDDKILHIRKQLLPFVYGAYGVAGLGALALIFLEGRFRNLALLFVGLGCIADFQIVLPPLLDSPETPERDRMEVGAYLLSRASLSLTDGIHDIRSGQFKSRNAVKFSETSLRLNPKLKNVMGADSVSKPGIPFLRYYRKAYGISDAEMDQLLHGNTGSEIELEMISKMLLLEKSAKWESSFSPLEISSLPLSREPTGFQLLVHNYDEVTLKISEAVPGFLYWAQNWDKNWRSYVNGQEVETLRAFSNFVAVQVPDGNSEVSFRFLPKNFVWTLKFHYAVFAVLLVSLMAASLRDSLLALATRMRPDRQAK